MKSGKLLTMGVVFILSLKPITLAQDAPNLANGIPSQGSFDGSGVDTVNLMNGNLAVHIPIPVDAPQRGKLAIKYYVVVNAKTWTAVPGIPNVTYGNQWTPNAGICATVGDTPSGPCGQGPVFVSTASFVLSRSYAKVTETNGGGTTYSVSDPTTLGTWDGSNHPLAGGYGGSFETADTSGYNIQISGSNAVGLPYNVVITDREGTQYSGQFHQYLCHTSTTNGGQDHVISCSERFITSTVTDANGNVLTAPLGIPDIGRPVNGPTIATHLAASSELTGCLTSFGTPYVAYLNYPAPGGATNQIKLCFATYPQLATSFSPAGIYQFQDVYTNHPFPGSYRQPVYLSNIILPDNAQWSINYDSYGEITSLATPTGAGIQYSWAEGQFPISSSVDITTVSRAVASRAVTDVNGHSFTWTYQWGTPASDHTMTHTVTDPLGNDTVHVFKPIQAIATLYPTNFKETSTVDYEGSGSTRTPLQQADTTFLIKQDGGLGVPTDVLTTQLPSQIVNLVHTDYDPSSPSLGLPISHKIYDWGQGSPGALLREEDIVYQWQKDSRYLAAHLVELPAAKIVVSPVSAANIKSSCPVDAAGTTKACMAETDYLYDEAAYLTSYEGTVGALPAGSHVAAPNAVRGNQTTVSKWLNTGAAVVSHVNWYDTGEVFQAIDPLGHTTTHSYDLAYAGALPSETCNPKGQCVSATYDVNTGLITSFTDANGSSQASGTTLGDPAHTSTYSYDFMRRMTSMVSPPDPSGNHPQVTFGYPDPVSVQQLKTITPTTNDSVTTHFDGLGRVSRVEHVTPAGTVFVDTVHDGLGHVTSVTNPYITTSDPTYGVTQTVYDALGRVIQVTKQDASISTASYAGNCTTASDEAGKPRKSCADGMDRLIEVDEPNPNAQASFASATVVINGSEQSNPQPGASGTGTVSITGSEGSTTVDPCADQVPPSSCPRTVWDTGSVSVTVNGVSKSAAFGMNSTASSVAAALAAAFHNDASSPVDASCSDAPCSSGVITLTARATGVATNYSLSASPSGSSGPDFNANVSGPNLTGGRDATSNPDTGTVTVTVNGAAYTTSYGVSDTASTIASSLAGIISGGTWVNASASANVVTVTSKVAGPGANYPLAASYTFDSAHFAQPSFTATASGSAMSGGYNASDLSNNPYVTLYSYDALGNLLRVDQKGSAPSDSTQWRTRLFTYDSLFRLTQSANSESGTINYTYDAVGNVITRTDARGITATNSYDALNRLTQRTYSDGLTPGAHFVYDVSSNWGSLSSPGANAVGRLSLAYTDGTPSVGMIFGYDALGRLILNSQCLPSNCGTGNYPVSAAYNLARDLTTLTYPSGRAVTFNYNSADRLNQVQFANFNGANVGYNYWSVADSNFYPTGAPKAAVFGNGVTDSMYLNSRLQPAQSIVSGAQTFLNRNYVYASPGINNNNGDVLNVIDNKNSGLSQNFSYDVLNRLSVAGTTATSGPGAWGLSFVYDAWGNFLQQNVTAGSASGHQYTAAANNRLNGYSYDADGNMLGDGFHSYTYNAESQITQVDSTAAKYTYDGQGARVRKDVGPNFTEYIYFGGQVIAERDQGGNWSDYVFANGKRIAKSDGFEDRLHIHAVECPNCGFQWYQFNFPNAGGLNARVIQTGDKLTWRQYALSGTSGGVDIVFTDGTEDWSTGVNLVDQHGEGLSGTAIVNQWNYRIADMSSVAGKAISQFRVNFGSSPGTWDLYYQDIVYQAADGTVIPLYSHNQALSLSGFGSSGVSQASYEINHDPNAGVYSAAVSTLYYHDDQIGSSRMITSDGGWPVWQGTFLPFGEEYNPQITTNHYKFTGKERDSETGLDYFGARYYSNGLGRFITPDWSAAPVPVPYADLHDPQTLCQYCYVRGLPTTRLDADGHCDICWTVIQAVAIYLGRVGIQEGHVRSQYNERKAAIENSKGSITSAERTALKQEMRQGSTTLGKALAEAHDAKTAAALAAKTPTQLEASAGNLNKAFNAAGKVGEAAGPVLTAAGVGIAAYNVATAPDGQKLNTAAKEGGGLGGALGGGELGAAAGAETGNPWVAGAGGIAGAIAGGIAGKGAVEHALNSPDSPDHVTIHGWHVHNGKVDAQ